MTEIFNTLLRFFSLRRSPEDGCKTPIAHLQRNWMMICVGALLLFLATSLFSGWLYLDVLNTHSEGTAIAPSVTTSGPTPAQINAILSQYSGRAVEYSQLLSTLTPIVDPAK